MSTSLINNVLMDVAYLHGKIIAGLSNGAATAPAAGSPAAQHLMNTVAALEVQIIDLINGGTASDITMLEAAMKSRSKSVLAALTGMSLTGAQPTEPAWTAFIAWADASDLQHVADMGVKAGPCLNQMFDIASRDPDYRRAIFEGLLPNGLPQDKRKSIWHDTRKAFWIGEVEDTAELLARCIELFPMEMSQNLHDLVRFNDALGAEILFVAGARPAAGARLVPAGTPCLPGGFIDRAKSNHELLAALSGPGPADLIQGYRDVVQPLATR